MQWPGVVVIVAIPVVLEQKLCNTAFVLFLQSILYLLFHFIKIWRFVSCVLVCALVDRFMSGRRSIISIFTQILCISYNFDLKWTYYIKYINFDRKIFPGFCTGVRYFVLAVVFLRNFGGIFCKMQIQLIFELVEVAVVFQPCLGVILAVLQLFHVLLS